MKQSRAESRSLWSRVRLVIREKRMSESAGFAGRLTKFFLEIITGLILRLSNRTISYKEICMFLKRTSILSIYGYVPHVFWTIWGATYYQERRKQQNGKEHKFLVDWCLAMKTESVLEVGCGFGRNLKLLACYPVIEVLTGMDFSKAMLNNARKCLNNSIRLVIASATHIPFRNDSFDFVFTHGVLMHVPPNQIEAVLREILRVSKKGIVNIEERLMKGRYSSSGIIKLNQYTYAYDYEKFYQKMDGHILCKEFFDYLIALAITPKNRYKLSD